MKQKVFLLALAAVFVLLPMRARGADADSLAFLRGPWQETFIDNGLMLQQCAVADASLFGSNQFLSVLTVAPERECALVAAPAGTLALTSALGREAGALAAVNGSFFHMKAPYGGSTFSRIDNVIVSENAPIENFRRDPQRSGAIVVREGRFSIATGFGPERTFEETLSGETILTAGPMLLLGGVRSDLHPFKFNSNRHPRTAFGIREDGTLVFLVADGRNAKAAGLTMTELQQIMIWLGCVDAINLDGGGSSTMVVRSGRSAEVPSGRLVVVNHPCDNRRFDADGERPVANAWVILPGGYTH
ncbi:MAG: phosphodiester glycosidase family protein [Bacteroidales bacterium]|nr:phosphodiester glycosidase family protein [Bacteroidales bacterium]